MSRFRNAWRIPVAILLLAGTAVVPVLALEEQPAGAQTFTGPPVADGVCVDQISCIDEAAYILWNATDPVFWQMAYVGARELLVQGQEMTDGDYGCSYPSWMTEEAASSGYSNYQQCRSRVLAEATFQYFAGLTAAEKDGFCDLLPWYVNCEPDPILPGGDYGAYLAGLGAVYYDPEYGSQPADGAAHFGYLVDDSVFDWSAGNETSISFWINSPIGTVGSHALFTGGTTDNWWALMSQSGGGVGLNVGSGSSTTRSQVFPGGYYTGPTPYMVTLTQNGDLWQLWINGTSFGAVTEDPPTNYAETYVYGWPPSMTWGADSYRWTFQTWHLAVFPGVLTQLDIQGLVAWGDDELFFGEEYTLSPQEVPVRPGTETEPTHTTEVAPTTTAPPVTPSTLVPEANPTGTHEERQTGLLENLVSGVADGFNWLGGYLGGLLRSIVDAIQWLGDIFGYWIRWLWTHMGWILRAIRDAINSLGDLMVWMLTTLQDAVVGAIQGLGTLLSGVWGAVASIPGLILDGLQWLFIPGDVNVDALMASCDTSFPCSWITEVVDASAEFGGVVVGTDTCTAPSFDVGLGGQLSLPAPTGCAGGNGAGDGAAGDLFGYREMMRAIFLVALIAGAMISVLQLTPWGFHAPIQPQQLTLFD